ncbi:ATP-dependent DNA helicase UvrD2 [Gordonia malaquae]|uniref:ATP-dependent DNA helicase UvrD2 n=1 Tax=Gordonia malaquae TaxID=410332 RepID=UPI0030C79DFF
MTTFETGALAGLDPEQLEAVTAPRGPVCVLAGAGTGKTRTITRRIAHLIESGQVNPSQVLAVTFTARAAAEMRERLAGLGVSGPGGNVVAQTFHAAALRQLRYFWPSVMGSTQWELLDHKFRLVARVARDAGLDSADRDLMRDLASEIEWAKSSDIGPAAYVQAAKTGHRDLPTDPRTVAQIFAAYEDTKASYDGVRLLDFEDLIIFTTAILQSEPSIADEFRSRYRSFVVDEYQDVTPIQQNLLDAWLGDRDDLTVVGDANQTIYSFTGATPDHLLNFTRRFPDATLVRLQRDYRSTPEVVELANNVIGKASGRIAGTRLRLVGQRDSGPAPVFSENEDEATEVGTVVGQVKKLLRAGVPATEIAILYRVNAQSEQYEEELSAAGIDYQVRGDQGFFSRPEIVAGMRRLVALAEGAPPPMPVIDAVRRALSAVGLTDTEPAGANAKARWQQLLRLVELAETVVAEQPAADFAAVVRELDMRSKNRHAPTIDGVTLSSMHAAKGLEWDAVFLTGLHEGSVPLGRATGTQDEVEEERRLFYVGVTRAREHLHLSWSLSRGDGRRATRKRSRFLDGVLPVPVDMRDEPRQEPDKDVFRSLRAWRKDFADRNDIMPANVLSEAMLRTIAIELPVDVSELLAIRGFGSERVDVIGQEVLDAVDRGLGGA